MYLIHNITINKCLEFTKVSPDYISTKGVTGFLAHEQLADIFYNSQEWQQAIVQQLRAVETGAVPFTAALRLALMTRPNS
ncbi:MAG: hypothetical protein LRZ99_01075 [Desulfotomaculum sp.]|nr:hypothetical protein [Desulfotomaculum sp.]